MWEQLLEAEPDSFPVCMAPSTAKFQYMDATAIFCLNVSKYEAKCFQNPRNQGSLQCANQGKTWHCQSSQIGSVQSSYLYLKEAGGFQDLLYILLCDEHLAGVGIVQEYIHGLCINSF